ncbi:hypothetical protein MTO96_034931 [Rhipicephalus appendiculatus]
MTTVLVKWVHDENWDAYLIKSVLDPAMGLCQLSDSAYFNELRGTVLDVRWSDTEDPAPAEGPVIKSVQQWQEWWRKQLYDARQDAAAIAEVQRSTGGGRASGFHGSVLQLTGTLRLTGVRPLDYQQVLEFISCNMRRLALAAEESTALLRRTAEAMERAASAQEAILRELREGAGPRRGHSE